MLENPFFDTFNAKHKTDQEIASSFVQPEDILRKLTTQNHAILSGPRGSGKTTLLKMLTHPALQHWKGGEALEFRRTVNFVAVFIAADRSWHGQLKRLQAQIPDQKAATLLGMSAFTTHIFKAIISSFIDWNNLSQDDKVTASLIPHLDARQEREVCEHLAGTWMLEPRAFTYLEMHKALSTRLAEIGILRNQLQFGSDALSDQTNRFLFVDYREGIKSAADIHNLVSQTENRRWSFIFDEMEVAPTFVQESLFSDLRGEVNKPKINYKLALAPFNKNFRSILDADSAAARHDYEHIDLSFARKENGYAFSRSLCQLMLDQAGVEETVDRLLGASYFAFEDENEADGQESKYSESRPLGKVFERLADKDAGFRKYLENRKLNLAEIGLLDENERAKTLRKFRNIAVMREYFSQKSSAGFKAEKLTTRSRKTYTLYTGNPTMLALSEGNPRSIINLFSPLVAEYKKSNGRTKVSERKQADEVQRAIRVMRSLLKTVPHKDKRYQGKGILSFLDDIGASLYSGVMSAEFPDNPPLSFRVTTGVNPSHLEAIGKALNIGALVYVPDQDSEDILSSVIGKRFRLNYMLAAHYKLPIALDRSVTLETLLGRKLVAGQSQMDLNHDN